LALLLEMTAGGAPDRVALGSKDGGITYEELLKRAQQGAAWLESTSAEKLVMLDVNSEALPIALFAASIAGKPFVPVNYRLADDRLRQILARTTPSISVTAPDAIERTSGIEGLETVTRAEFLAHTESGGEHLGTFVAPDEVAIVLFTSGTTGDPKAALLRHEHIVAYIVGSVEFLGCSEDEAALVSVPPYHIAGISAILSSTYGGRRIVYLPQFEPTIWVNTARAEGITHAMVVPTMLDRILDEIEAQGESIPSLRHLSYGGGRMPIPVIERAMHLLPDIGFVNAYGLTETSSTVAILTPEDHYVAINSTDPTVWARLGSVGKPLPGIEVEIRDEEGHPVAAGVKGEIWVRGEQVSGEYEGVGATLTPEGWFPTKDGGYLDAEGYLYVEGRLDDVIVRGGENLSPGEIEDVILAHPAVMDVGVVGVPDQEWGETVAAFVVLHEGQSATPDEIAEHVVSKLRSSRRPTVVEFLDELPYNETGKLLRRVLREQHGNDS
jgi:acyl-CoA synthetase (AMP-forming)/AMP-acid ligase II